MRTIIIILLAFTFGILVAGIRMTDDPKEDTMLKLKRVNDGTVLFVPYDNIRPYDVGDVFYDVDSKYMVIEIVKSSSRRTPVLR